MISSSPWVFNIRNNFIINGSDTYHDEDIGKSLLKSNKNDENKTLIGLLCESKDIFLLIFLYISIESFLLEIISSIKVGILVPSSLLKRVPWEKESRISRIEVLIEQGKKQKTDIII